MMPDVCSAFIVTNARVLLGRAFCGRADKAGFLPLASSMLECTNYLRSYGLYALQDLYDELDPELARMLDPIVDDWDADLVIQTAITRILASYTDGAALFKSLLCIVGLSAISYGESAARLRDEFRALFGADGDLVMTLLVPSPTPRKPARWESALERILARSGERGLSGELNARLLKLGETQMRKLLRTIDVEFWTLALGFSASEELWRHILVQIRPRGGNAFLEVVLRRETATDGQIEGAQRIFLETIGPLLPEPPAAGGQPVRKTVQVLSQEEIDSLLSPLNGP